MKQSKITRRSLGKISAAVAVAATASRVSPQTNTPSESTPLSIKTRRCAVSLIPSTDDRFQQILQSHFAGLAADPHFAKIASTCAILSHDHGKAIRAYSVTWTVQGSQGSFETTLYRYAHAGVKRAPGKKTAGSGELNVLRKNSYRLVSPFFSITPKHVEKHGTPNWNKLVAKTAIADFLSFKVEAQPSVQMTLNAIVFARSAKKSAAKGKSSTGASTAATNASATGKKRKHARFKSAGPAAVELGHRFRVKRNAEHDQACAVLKLIKAGASKSDIAEYLHTGATSSRPSVEGPKRWYIQARRASCAHMLTQLRTAPPAAFQHSLLKLQARPKARVTKAA